MNFNNIDEYADYYVSQLILQYISKPKACATIDALARSMHINFANMGKWRSLKYASGDALVAIAELFGVDGFYDGISFKLKYFATEAYFQNGNLTPAQEGFQEYNSPKDGLFFKYSDYRKRSVLVNVSDSELRGLIRMKALIMMGNVGTYELQDIFDRYFNGVYISESYSPPTVIYNVPQRHTLAFALFYQRKYLLKPPGVNVEINSIGE